MLPDSDKVRSALSSHPKVLSAWLFGSQISGGARPDSDLDVGLLVDGSLSANELIRLNLDLIEASGNDRVDLSILNRASPLLAFEALRGENVFCRDPQRQADFYSLTCRKYERAMAMWQRGLKYRQEAG